MAIFDTYVERGNGDPCEAMDDFEGYIAMLTCEADDESRRKIREVEETAVSKKASIDLKFDAVRKKARAESRRASERRGICLAFIVGRFSVLARDRSPNADPDFYELKPLLAIGDSGLGKGKQCPRDFELDCSIVDAVAANQRGMCTHFLSWCWAYKLSVMVSALSLWCQDPCIAPGAVQLLCCFFANNQYRIMANYYSEVLRSIFEERLISTRNLLVLMDTFDDSQWSKRLWCVFEAFIATTNQIDFKVILPDAGRKAFITMIQSGGLAEVKQRLWSLDIRNSHASEPSDERDINACIKRGVGHEVVNKCVIEKLSDCLAKEVDAYLRRPVAKANDASYSQATCVIC